MFILIVSFSTHNVLALGAINESATVIEYYLMDSATGEQRRISVEEYFELTEQSPESRITADTISKSSVMRNMSVTPNSTPTVTIWYSFTVSSIGARVAGSVKRVSDTYGSTVLSMNVSRSITTTRTVTNSGGVTITAEMQKEIDAKVTGSYGLAVSNSSATAQSITGSFAPKPGKYLYNWITFHAWLQTATGKLAQMQTVSLVGVGSTTSKISEWSVSVKYPVKGASGYTDGHFDVAATNSSSSVPPLG